MAALDSGSAGTLKFEIQSRMSFKKRRQGKN